MSLPSRPLGCSLLLVLLLPLLHAAPIAAYPTDAYERTGIRRLKWQYDIDHGVRRGRKMPPGGQWPSEKIVLRMTGKGRHFKLTRETPKDPEMQKALTQILRKWSWRRYNVAILDITDPAKPRFAGVNEHHTQTPGSVAKVLVASGMLQQLKERFPNDITKRENVLRTHRVSADDWARSDSHTVPIFSDPELKRVSHRRIRTGDTFTLWEWMDHALSASNNSAASTLWREATLMKLMGKDYPPEKYDAALWKQWDRATMSEASFAVVDRPLLDSGISLDDFHLRLYFTTGANRYIRSSSSVATPFSMIQWMVQVEQGRMIDEWSSLELKRMLYITRRRVRYLYTKKLDNFGALFKSGSLYRFSEGAERIQYQGDIINVLNSLIEIDTTPPPEPAAEPVTADAKAAKVAVPIPKAAERMGPPVPRKPPYVYIVAVMSNELKRNAALDHSKLAEAVHEMITGNKPTSER